MRSLRRPGLAVQIIGWSFVPTLAILIAVALMTFYAYQQVTEDLVMTRDEEVTRLSASQLAIGLSDYAGILDTVGRSVTTAGTSAVDRRAALDAGRNRLVVFDAGVALLDTHGAVEAVSGAPSELVGQSWAGQPFFQALVRSPDAVFSDVVSIAGRDVVVLVVPVLGERGARMGALAGLFRIGATGVSAFYGSIVRLRLGETGALYLVDRNGRVLYHSDSDRIGEDFSALPAVRAAQAGRSGALRTRDFDGQDIVAGFAPVPGTPWAVVNEERWDALMGSSRSYQRFLLMLLALGVIVPTVVTAVGVRRITRPIRDLTGAAQAVAGGDFGQVLAIRTGNELEDLAAQFNTMSRQLAASYGELEERVKSLLVDAQRAAALEERQRLSRDLHDSVTQSLYSLTLLATAARRLAGNGSPERLAAPLDQLVATAQQALKEMRLLVFDLRPLELETEGLVGAVRRRLEAVERQAGIRTELAVECCLDVPAASEVELYRIVQEALNNTLKHARATHVNVRLSSTPGAVRVEVADNGRGFDPAAVADGGGLGLRSVRERAAKLGAKLAIESAPGGGTRVVVDVPREEAVKSVSSV